MPHFEETPLTAESYQLAIPSMALGRAWLHPIRQKLDQAEKHGFHGIELFHEDLEHLAKEDYGSACPDSQIRAAHTLRSLCDERNLKVFAMQPFRQYEGLKDRSQHQQRIEEMKLWIRLCKIIGAEYIGVPSTFLAEDQISGDMDLIVADLREIADLGAMEDPPVKFAYESLAWGTYVDTWEACYQVVQKVDRPNFGICLDTFNIAARVYADPTSPCGKTRDADIAMTATIKRLLRTVDLNKVFYVQVVDAERLEQPLVEGHEFYVEGNKPRMNWSRNCRLFYGEQERGGYLPIKDISLAIFKELGFKGWVSMELFSRTLEDPHESVPEAHAARAALSWMKLKKDMSIE